MSEQRLLLSAEDVELLRAVVPSSLQIHLRPPPEELSHYNDARARLDSLADRLEEILRLFTVEDVEALGDVESDVPNGSDTDPRVYICVWQEERLQARLRSLPDRLSRLVQGDG